MPRVADWELRVIVPALERELDAVVASGEPPRRALLWTLERMRLLARVRNVPMPEQRNGAPEGAPSSREPAAP
jgi:hypothetical protein